jgi:hypothetical protein
LQKTIDALTHSEQAPPPAGSDDVYQSCSLSPTVPSSLPPFIDIFKAFGRHWRASGLALEEALGVDGFLDDGPSKPWEMAELPNEFNNCPRPEGEYRKQVIRETLAEEDRKLFDSYDRHPVHHLVRRTHELSGLPVDDLYAAAWRIDLGLAPDACFTSDLTWLLSRFRKLDQDGTTAALWSDLLAEEPSFLGEVGLQGRAAPLARPPTDRDSPGLRGDAEQILARARAVQDRQAADRRKRQKEAEDRHRCEQAVRAFDKAVGELGLSQDPLAPDKVDPAPFFPRILEALSAACRVCRESGLDARWAQVNRGGTFRHYRSQLKPEDGADVPFDYGCHLLDLGFHGDLRQDAIATAWEQPVLRGSLTVAGILLRGLVGTQRIEFDPQPHSTPEQASPTLHRDATVMAHAPRTQVFFSYSHKDKIWLERFQTALKPAVRADMLWDDTKIEAGSKWKEEIQRALSSAKVAVLLVSPDFLASDFITKHELPPLLQAAEQEGLTILWVAVRASMYQETEIAEFQAARNPSQPLANLRRPGWEKAIVAICKKIKAAVEVSTHPNPE